MNINLEYYKSFYIVAKHENISKAAQTLNISQPALSKTIKNLEDELGSTLFIRTKKGMKITEEGKELFKYIEQGLKIIENGEKVFSNITNLETGTLRIGSNKTIIIEFLMEYIKKYHKLYPNIKIELITNSTNLLLSDLQNGLIDLAVINTDLNHKTNNFKVINIKKTNHVFVCNKDFIELTTKSHTIKDLENYPFVLQNSQSHIRETLNNYLKSYNFHPTNHIEVPGYSLNIECIKAGLGIGLAVKEYLDNDLYIIDIKEKLPSRYISVITKKTQNISACNKKFIELLKEQL